MPAARHRRSQPERMLFNRTAISRSGPGKPNGFRGEGLPADKFVGESGAKRHLPSFPRFRLADDEPGMLGLNIGPFQRKCFAKAHTGVVKHVE